MFSPIEQFDILSIFELGFFGFILDVTNSSLVLFFCLVLLFFVFFCFSFSRFVPNFFQFFFEFFFRILFKFVFGLVGNRGLIFFPFFFTLFIFILFCNLLGLFPFGFTVTSHVIVTFFFSGTVLVGCFFLGLLNYGLVFFRLFVSDSVPLFLLPFFILLELLSYIIRVFSLSIRLSANMLAGHVLLHLLSMFFFRFLNFGLLFVVVLIFLLVAIFLLEVVVAFLQAYVFVTLTCVYFNEALYLH